MEKLGSKCGHEVAAIGITNQRETLVAWDKLTGAPLCPAIVWLDVRTWPQCARLKEELGGVVSTCAPQGCWSPQCSQALSSPIYLGGFPVTSNTRTSCEACVFSEVADFGTKSDYMLQDALRQITGLPISTYSSSCKWVWMLENIPAVELAYAAGRCQIGTVETWLIYNLTGGVKGETLHDAWRFPDWQLRSVTEVCENLSDIL